MKEECHRCARLTKQEDLKFCLASQVDIHDYLPHLTKHDADEICSEDDVFCPKCMEEEQCFCLECSKLLSKEDRGIIIQRYNNANR